MEKQDITKVEPLRDYIIAELEVKASEAAKENAEHTLKAVKCVPDIKGVKAVKCGPDVKGVKAGDTLLVNPFEFVPHKVKLDDEHYIFPESVVIAVRRLT